VSDWPPHGRWRDPRTGRQWKATKAEMREVNRLAARAHAFAREDKRPPRPPSQPRPRRPAPVARPKPPLPRRPDCGRCRTLHSVRDGLCGWCWLRAWKAGEASWDHPKHVDHRTGGPA
jgi:hypothetical protein